MKPRLIVPRKLAERDISEAVAHYLTQGSSSAALGFVDALEQAFAHLGRQPASGSPRYAHEVNIPGLRVWPLKRYPYLVFYVERDDQIDVWRILHGSRDIPAWMREPGGS